MRDGLTEDDYRHVHEHGTDSGFTEAERLAIEYAERFALDNLALQQDEEFWRHMKATFTDAQILELSVLVGFCIAIGRTFALLDVANDCAINLTKDPDPIDSARP